MTSGSMTSNKRTIVAFFDRREDADRAVQKLGQAGVTQADIKLVQGERGTGSAGASTGTGASTGGSGHEMGLWESLKDLFLPEEDRHTYAEGLRRGGYLVSVRAADAQYDRVLDILDDEGTVDMEQRETAWRKEGWKGYQAGAAGTSAGGLTGGTSAGLTGAVAGSSRAGAPTTGATTASTGAAGGTTGREEAIPIVEEQLKVGKRAVEQGRVRIRSYMVETPVNEQVSLREEHVSVERRPVDRPLTAGDNANLFKDRTIEAEERSEQAVVSKEARVKEEVALRKDVEQRTETVTDKVRHTEVEVVDERGNKVPPGGRNPR